MTTICFCILLYIHFGYISFKITFFIKKMSCLAGNFCFAAAGNQLAGEITKDCA